MIGRATTLAAWRMPMISRMPPIRASSSFSCAPVDRCQSVFSTNVTVKKMNEVKMR